MQPMLPPEAAKKDFPCCFTVTYLAVDFQQLLLVKYILKQVFKVILQQVLLRP